jgi:GNAT superfamily N-acetyltransferase
MRTARQHSRKGVATQMLEHIIQQAKTRNLERLSLETGTQAFFNPLSHFTNLMVLCFVSLLHSIKLTLIVNL